ncbi:MAG: hypothetical protein F6K19_23175 [Cyanothece sp. SIO1E1]|nr:hypothetical protein [Cyanothece sp. SIO1E1]
MGVVPQRSSTAVDSRSRFYSHLPSGLLILLLVLQFPHFMGLLVGIACLIGCFPQHLSTLTHHAWFKRSGGWKLAGVGLGMLLFVGIIFQADPALAQLFDQVESQAQGLFGQYLDQGIIAFLFGILRIVIWVSAIGFIFFAVYQAQRGEQWQPLLQNAFIIIAAVVVVEGLSTLFFGS